MGKLVKKESKDLTTNEIPPHVNVGTVVINGRGETYKIIKIQKNGKIELGYIGDNGDDRDGQRYGSYDSYQALIERYTILEKPLEEYEAELIKELTTGFKSFHPDEDVKSTDMVLSGGKDRALESKRHIEALTHKVEVMEAILEKRKSEIYQIRRGYEQQLKQLNRVIGIIELYLGVHSDIVQVQEGTPADENEPICFRQLVLHMDEEVALDDDTEGGIDFTKIEVFDKWIRKNIRRVLPEKKGVVVARPRRYAKDYKDPFLTEQLNEHNVITYIIIRNGMNIYRIKTEDLNIYPHLFPTEREMKILTGEIEPEHWSDRISDSDKEDIQLGYKRNVLFLQGLLDRTDVFKPHPIGLHLLKPETYGNHIKFIYDANVLSDGRPSYHQWLEEMNKDLKRGDRVYVTAKYSIPDEYEYERRYPVKASTYNKPTGVFNIKRVEDYYYGSYGDEPKEALIINYNPKDIVYSRADYGERKQAIPFRLFRDDDFILNYEKVTVEDIEYYLQDRVNRKHYVEMMPVLKGIRKQLLEERKWEDGFVELVKYQTNAPEEKIREAIEWWKRKVIEKRPLTKEDAKAVRMIKKYLKSGDTGEAVE